MADRNYPDDMYASGGGGQRAADPMSIVPATAIGRGFRIMGALASLALVAGVGIWGYKLMVRDVSGVPVVRALEGPMRIQPDDPGGAQADNQGLAVNAVAALGSAAPIADRVMLAPGPVELTEEDTSATQAADLAEATNDLDSLSVEALVAQLTGNSPTQDVTASEEGPQAALAPVANVADEDLEIEPAQQAGDQTGSGLPRSLRPPARPARAVATGGTGGTGGIEGNSVLNSAINSAVDTVARLDIDPDSLPVGTRLAQLGAYDSADVARAEWVKMTTKFDEYFLDKQPVIQKASSGGRTFYRLRAMGFDDLSAARRFCSALVSENTDCIPVTTR